jgi:hypothetical protein
MGDPSISTQHEALTDQPSQGPVASASISPNRARRYAIFDDGDVRVFAIARTEDHPTPVGCLIPLEGAPGFQTAQEARSWLRRQGGLSRGRRLLVAKIQAILELQEVSQPKVRLTERPRRPKRDLPGQQKLPGT